MPVNLGPDAARYWHSAGGAVVSRPFNMRMLLPVLCRQNIRRWWVAWAAGWVLAAGGMFAWQYDRGWQVAAASAVLLIGLPGFLGPSATIPVGVDIPTTGLTVCAVALWEHGYWNLAVIPLALAAAIRETSPVVAALLLWNPLPLFALVIPVMVGAFNPPGPDPLGAKFQAIADHPVRSALEFHRGRWRDGWLMVAPWGACLAALLAPSWQLGLVLVVAYAQLLVATDSVRLYQHAAGPLMAATAVTVIPSVWLLLACVVHVVWWRAPERV